MTSQHLTGNSTSQLDGYLHGIRMEFDRLNQELDEAKKKRDEYETNYKNQEKELRGLMTLILHRLNGKDQFCQHCKAEITHTARLAGDNPSMSPASPSSEYYSPSEENGVAIDRLDNTGNSVEIIRVEKEQDQDVDVGEGAILDIISTNEVGKSGWDIEYNDGTEIALKLDLMHDLPQEGGTCVAFSPDGKYLATASDIGIVCIFDVNTGERISVMKDLYPKPDEYWAYSCLGFSPDNNYLATGDTLGKVTIWMISERRVRNAFKLLAKAYIRDLNFSPNGRHLVTCSFDNSVRIWRLRDGFSRVLSGSQRTRNYTPWAVRFSPDGRYVASGYNPEGILIWYVRSRRLVAEWEGHSRPVSSLVFTPDGKGLLTASWDKTIVLWDITWLSSSEIILDDEVRKQDGNSTVREISRFVGHTNEVDTVSISPDGNWILSGSQDKTARIWNAHDTTLQCTLRPHDFDSIRSVAFCPVGTYLAIGGLFPEVTIWEYANL